MTSRRPRLFEATELPPHNGQPQVGWGQWADGWERGGVKWDWEGRGGVWGGLEMCWAGWEEGGFGGKWGWVAGCRAGVGRVGSAMSRREPPLGRAKWRYPPMDVPNGATFGANAQHDELHCSLDVLAGLMEVGYDSHI